MVDFASDRCSEAVVLILFDFVCSVSTGRRAVSLIYGFVTTFYVGFVLSSIVITYRGEDGACSCAGWLDGWLCIQ